jgi:hypothetical protein
MGVKPLLLKRKLTLLINDEVVLIGDRFYIKATAVITDGINSVSNTAFAREAEQKKGMDASQVTGATSSYARKYALNGLLCIDDNKDADTQDNRPHVKHNEQPVHKKEKPVYVSDLKNAKSYLGTCLKNHCAKMTDQEKGDFLIENFSFGPDMLATYFNDAHKFTRELQPVLDFFNRKAK